MNDDNFIIEFITMGNSVKVTVVDPVTGREVSTIGPKTASQAQLSKAGVNKMLYVMNKEKSETSTD
ncbi:MAG: hypothetical protein HOH19_12520 [Kordiimonadaceae bacterium]|nr:hypothetical protein [Kordiimonadaceae bacterium]